MDVSMTTITIGATGAAIIALAFAVWTKKDWLKNFAAGGIVIWFASYAMLMFAGSLLNFNVPPNTNDLSMDARNSYGIDRIIGAVFIGDNTFIQGQNHIKPEPKSQKADD